MDLFLRYLPDVTRMAQGIGKDDPLVEYLQQAAVRWPLSSVGMCSVACDIENLKPILSDRCLKRLYVDRIIELGDISRLDPPEIRDGTGAALGAHLSLAPQISNAIANLLEQT